MSKVLVRASDGEVFNEVISPAILFDKDSFALFKIGEAEAIQSIYEQWHQQYTQTGFLELAEALTWMEIPNDQELVDKIFNISGYIKVFLKDFTINL